MSQSALLRWCWDVFWICGTFSQTWHKWAASNSPELPANSGQPGHLPSVISLYCALIGKLRTQGFFMQTANSDQTGQMSRLIWVFAGCTWICWFCRAMVQMPYASPSLSFLQLCHKVPHVSWQNKHNDMCAQWRLRSDWASAQSDQSLRCPHEESLGP